MWNFLSSIFWILFWIVLVLGCIAFMSYNKLQRQAQFIRERSSNIQVSISKKLSLINQLIDVVKSFQEGEQLVHLKISQDNSVSSISASYQQSGTILSSVQGMADRFPNLKSNEQYKRLIDSIQSCESDIQEKRQSYNESVRTYNTARLSMPTVFVAGMLGFSVAPYLEFDVSGVAEQGQLKIFKTDDGERLQQLLSNAGGQIAGASKLLASHASNAGRMAVETIRERSQTGPNFFYQVNGGAPAGPVSLQQLRNQLATGQLTGDVKAAQVGTNDWLDARELVAMHSTGV